MIGLIDAYIDKEIRQTVLHRAVRLDYARVRALLGAGFVLAGGSLCSGEVHDYDVYPEDGGKFDLGRIASAIGECEHILARTRNALTVRLANGQVVQFCAYSQPSLRALVESFDYAHVQVGVRFRGDDAGRQPTVDDVFYTPQFVAANATGRTKYVGSEYPLASAVRALKYHSRKKMDRGTAARSVIKAFADVIRRGFKDYEDFKDQLDAIDLGLPYCDEVYELWCVCRDAGLVKDPTCEEHAE